MPDQISPVYAELLGKTAQISWAELAPFFARGKLLWIASEQDLIEVASHIVADDKAAITRLMQDNQILQMSDEQALDFHQRDPELWATVVSPWVLVQERATA